MEGCKANVTVLYIYVHIKGLKLHIPIKMISFKKSRHFVGKIHFIFQCHISQALGQKSIFLKLN